jgi:hypothetical protein
MAKRRGAGVSGGEENPAAKWRHGENRRRKLRASRCAHIGAASQRRKRIVALSEAATVTSK